MPDIAPADASQAAPVVEPTQPAAPAAPPPETAEAAPAPSLPEALTRIPVIQGLLGGVPPAVSMHLKGSEDRDEVKLLSENKDALLAHGFYFYQSMSGKFGVMANSLYIHPQDLQAADKAGKLLAVAPDFDLANHAVAKMGLNHPIHNPNFVPPTAPASPVSTAPPQAAAMVPRAPASVQRRLAQQRIANLNPGAPTSGPEPGAGRILNSIMRPVI